MNNAKQSTASTLRVKYAVSFMVGNDLVTRKADVLSDTLTARAFVARFHPNAVFEGGYIVVPARAE
jgi:UDP-N-acetylglucosamine:LPS N-acetylglucosamine transferase